MVDFDIQFVSIAAPATNHLDLVVWTSSSCRWEYYSTSKAVSSKEGRVKACMKECLLNGFDKGPSYECLAILFTEEGAVRFLGISLEKVLECGNRTGWLPRCSSNVYGDTLLKGVCFRGWECEDNVGWVFKTWDELDGLSGWQETGIEGPRLGGELATAKKGRVGEAASSVGGDIPCFCIWLELLEE